MKENIGVTLPRHILPPKGARREPEQEADALEPRWACSIPASQRSTRSCRSPSSRSSPPLPPLPPPPLPPPAGSRDNRRPAPKNLAAGPATAPGACPCCCSWISTSLPTGLCRRGIHRGRNRVLEVSALAANRAENDYIRVAVDDVQGGIRTQAVGMRSQDMMLLLIHSYGQGARTLDTLAVQQHIATHAAAPRAV